MLKKGLLLCHIWNNHFQVLIVYTGCVIFCWLFSSFYFILLPPQWTQEMFVLTSWPFRCLIWLSSGCFCFSSLVDLFTISYPAFVFSLYGNILLSPLLHWLVDLFNIFYTGVLWIKMGRWTLYNQSINQSINQSLYVWPY